MLNYQRVAAYSSCVLPRAGEKMCGEILTPMKSPGFHQILDDITVISRYFRLQRQK